MAQPWIGPTVTPLLGHAHAVVVRDEGLLVVDLARAALAVPPPLLTEVGPDDVGAAPALKREPSVLDEGAVRILDNQTRPSGHGAAVISIRVPAHDAWVGSQGIQGIQGLRSWRLLGA